MQASGTVAGGHTGCVARFGIQCLWHGPGMEGSPGGGIGPLNPIDISGSGDR